jgi:dihydroorotate dehydrogenase electron transfer subunit
LSRYFKAEIKENRPVNKSHNLLILSCSNITDNPIPGQFYMIGTNTTYDPLLKRPFSIFGISNPPSPPFSKGGMVMTRRGGFRKELQFLYRIKGKGTEKMRQMKEGDTINLLGPLGNGYPHLDKNIEPLLIAGGIGIASLFPLIERFSGNILLFYGARTKDELLMLDELKAIIKKEFIISTDDGSMGEKGTVVDVLNRLLTPNSELRTPNLLIYACGPSQMLKAVSMVALEKEIKGYISMEENMACGVGACLGCAVKAKRSPFSVQRLEKDTEFTYKRVCKEGPVFRIGDIVW